MKKRITLFIATMFLMCTAGFSQTHSTVKLSDSVYELLENAEAQGLCTNLFTIKPYTQKYIVSKLEEIKTSLENNKGANTETELEVVNNYIERFAALGKSSKRYLRIVHRNDKDNLPLVFGAYGTLEGMMSGGIYKDKSQNAFGFEEWQTIGFFGDIGSNVSFDWDGGVAFTKMPLQQMKGEYHIGSWWNEAGGIDKPDDIYGKRFINTFKNYSVLPYHYVKHWDGSIYNLDDFNAGGLKGWPNVLSFGITMQGGIETSFFNNRLYIGISRKNREWSGMDKGASLALNANARPFLGIEASFKPLDWISFGALTGFLEWPNQSHILKDAWYIPNGSGGHTQIVPSAKDSFFFQDMFAINIMNIDLKYFHFDFGSTCIFPKRFELGYMFPLFEKIVYQNNLGDFDNLGLFASMKGRFPGLGSIWVSAYVDEINAPNIKTMFEDTRCMFAWQAGLKSVFPLLAFGNMSFRYTKVEPYCYTHTAVKLPYYSQYVASAYINNGVPLGYYLEPNSDEFFFRIEGKPITNLNVGLQYQLIRHGTTWGEGAVEGSSIYSEMEPYDRDSHHKYFLRDGVYEWTSMVILDGSYDFRSHRLPMELTFSAGYIYDWFTSSGKYNTPSSIRLIDNKSPLYATYPTTSGVVLSMGFKFFTF